jgi:hypothetical protein
MHACAAEVLMRFRYYVVAACLLFFPALAQAQDFGVLESAETINRGNFKLKGNGILILEEGDDEPGGVADVGYGFTDSFDFEAKLAFYEHATIVGGDVEFWLVKKPHPIDLSVSAGFHYANADAGDQTGVDVTVIGSHAMTSRLDLYAALDMNFNKYRADFPDNSYNQILLVPGIEYKLHRDLDLVAEFGIALNDNANNYVAGGLAYYIR